MVVVVGSVSFAATLGTKQLDVRLPLTALQLFLLSSLCISCLSCWLERSCPVTVPPTHDPSSQVFSEVQAPSQGEHINFHIWHSHTRAEFFWTYNCSCNFGSGFPSPLSWHCEPTHPKLHLSMELPTPGHPLPLKPQLTSLWSWWLKACKEVLFISVSNQDLMVLILFTRLVRAVSASFLSRAVRPV